MAEQAQHPQTLTFDAGVDFIETNKDADNWLLQVEAFDPHEPFFSSDDDLARYEAAYRGRHFDWPAYRRTIEDDEEIAHLRNTYFALLTMCDRSLGRVLDVMDEHEMWNDTMLIVCTDHGLLLGEHNWWGKNVQPWFDENIHTPLFIWDPRTAVADARRDSLVQTIDIGPTILDFFGMAPTSDMQGVSLEGVIRADHPVREAALFGNAGSHVNVTDGRYVYMRACATADNAPLYDYTLMPTHMGGRFSPRELQDAELVAPFTFTKGVPVLRVPAYSFGNPHVYGTQLYDLHADPHQEHPLRDDELELRMVTLLVDLMRKTDAPAEQYQRLGLPAEGPIAAQHLLIDRQWDLIQSSRGRAPRASDFPAGAPVSTIPLSDLLDTPGVREAIVDVIPFAAHPFMARLAGAMTLVEVAAMRADLGKTALNELNDSLNQRGVGRHEPTTASMKEK